MVGTFDEQSIRRIAKAVLDSERRNRSRQLRGKRNRDYPPQGGEEAGFDRVKGLAAGAFTSANATITIDNVVATKGPSPLSDPGSSTETLTVQNSDFQWDGDDNAPVYAEFHVDDGLWWAYQVKCPA